MDNAQLQKLRNDYKLMSLTESDTSDDAMKQFQSWFDEVLKAEVYEANAMVLSTTHVDFKPASRIVLLKGVEDGSFVFFTNYHSRKGKEMLWNPYAALLFFWKELERQVRIEGRIEKIESELSDEYFETRPRGSQLGAWASNQSEVIESRDWLEQKLKSTESQYKNLPVPRPPYWGGYRLIANSIEFWQGRYNRLHDRILYTRINGNEWKKERLAP